MIRNRHIDKGDWVRTTRTVPTSAMDELTGTGIQAGTRGVTTNRSGRWLTVEFGAGLATRTTRVNASHCQLIRRGAGHHRFHQRTRLILARLSIAAFLLWPIVQFTILYFWQNHTLEGIGTQFANAVADTTVDTFNHLLTHPLQTAIYVGFLTVLSRFAFRH